MRKYPYRCPGGKLTVAVGRNLDDLGISEDEAMFMLDNDISRVEKELIRRLPVYAELSETRKIVLCDMCFNLGISRLMKFKKMIAALEAGDFTKAANEMADSRWANQVGLRAIRLMRFMISDKYEIYQRKSYKSY